MGLVRQDQSDRARPRAGQQRGRGVHRVVLRHEAGIVGQVSAPEFVRIPNHAGISGNERGPTISLVFFFFLGSIGR